MSGPHVEYLFPVAVIILGTRSVLSAKAMPWKERFLAALLVVVGVVWLMGVSNG